MIERSLRDALVVGLDVAGERCFKFSPRFETRLPNNFSDATVEALDHAVGLQGPRSRRLAASATTRSTAVRMRPPLANRAHVQTRSSSSSNHGGGIQRLLNATPLRRLAALASVAPASPI